jgi:hypothetical protein
LALYSEQFDNAYWLNSGLTLSANSVVSPDGTQNADTATETSATSQHGLSSGLISFTSGTTYTFSTFAKNAPSGRGFIQLYGYQLGAAAANVFANFDLNTGVVGSVSGGTSTITNYGNGWYRCTFTFACGNSLSERINLFNVTSASATSGQSYVGDITKAIYWWGAQVEQSSYPTSYIPTTSASATRVADGPVNLSATQTLTNFTLFYDGLIFQNGENMLFGSGNSAWYIDVDGSNGRVVLDLTSGRIYTGFNAGITTNQRFKLAIKRSAGVVDAFVNGTKLTPTTQVTDTTSLTLSSITWGFSSTQYPKMKVNEICAFQSALSDSDCQALTTL